MTPSFRFCYITDRVAIAPTPLEEKVDAAVTAGIDLIQIREKDLPTPELFALSRAAVHSASGTNSKIIINDRLDVALAVEADGVHLGGQSIPVAAARPAAAPGFLIGASCHSLEEAVAAESAGASYVLLGPIFATPSKARYGPPLGLEKLAMAAGKVKIPILALGGISPERVRVCLERGATGVAGIRLFQGCESMAERARELQAIFEAVRK